MAVSVVVHRSAHEIGGNCIEVTAPGGERVLLDVGEPLSAPGEKAAPADRPATLDLGRPATVLVSHAHQDHYGLLRRVPAAWPAYCGPSAAKLIRLTAGMRGTPIDREFLEWRSGQPFAVGPFTITPYLTDHSAFDAYMLLVEVAGKRILYSGDFRRHGRKAALVDRMMASPPGPVDLLVMEGTNVGTDKPWMSEDDLEGAFARTFRATPGRVFVSWSGQNVDRTVTIYRACLEAERTLVVDLYAAEVLDLLSDYPRLPRVGSRNLKVVVTGRLAGSYRRRGRGDFVDRIAKSGRAFSAKKLVRADLKDVIMVRGSLVGDFEKAGVSPTRDDCWIWSMWAGYLEEPDGVALRRWFAAGGAREMKLHTSGHASPADLKAFANAVGARAMVPVHGLAWDDPQEGFPPMIRLADGERLALS